MSAGFDQRIADLSDTELESLHANALRLAETGAAEQRRQAEELLPLLGPALEERRARRAASKGRRGVGGKAKAKSQTKERPMSQITEALEAAGFIIFARALSASPYSEILDGGRAYTVFAPTDTAFGKFSQASLDQLLHGDEALRRTVIGYHFAAGKVSAARFAGSRIRAVMYAGGDVIIDGKHGGLRVNKANLIKPDIVVGNCVVHGIDGVLWPSEPAAAR